LQFDKLLEPKPAMVPEDALLLIPTAELTAGDPAAPARSGLAQLSATGACGSGMGRPAVVRCAPRRTPCQGPPRWA